MLGTAAVSGVLLGFAIFLWGQLDLYRTRPQMIPKARNKMLIGLIVSILSVLTFFMLGETGLR